MKVNRNFLNQMTIKCLQTDFTDQISTLDSSTSWKEKISTFFEKKEIRSTLSHLVIWRCIQEQQPAIGNNRGHKQDEYL